MLSNEATLNHKHQRAQRYARQGASDIPDYNTIQDERGGDHFDILHLPTGDTSDRYEGEDEESQTSRDRQRHGEETPVSNSDLMPYQYDAYYDSLDRMQRLLKAHYPDQGEDGHRKKWLSTNPKPHRSGNNQCTHSEDGCCTGYPRCLSRDKWLFEEMMACIGKEKKWKRGWHGTYDDELPDHNKWGREQVNLMKAKRRSERGQYGIFCSHKSDNICTGPSWGMSREDCPFKPEGSDSLGGDGFTDVLPNEHKDTFLPPKYGKHYGEYYMRNAGSGRCSLRGGHGDDVEDHSSPSEPHQPTVEDAPDVNAYLYHFEQGRSSQAAEDHQQNTDNGLGRPRAMHANSRAENEEAQARFKKYLEASRQDHRRLEESDAIERILRQERADLERRNAQRATTETRPQVEQVPVQPYEDCKGKGEAPAATNNNTHPREESSLLEQVAEHPKANSAPRAGNGGRNMMDEHRAGQIHGVDERILSRLLPLPLLPLPHQGHLEWREAERTRIEARLRAAQQAADEAYMTLLTHDDLLDAEIAMCDQLSDLEGKLLEGHAHRVPGDFRPAFLPMPPLWPRHLAAEGRPYPGWDFPPRPPRDHWIHQQLYHDAYPLVEAGRLDDPRAAVPYPQRLLPLPYYRAMDGMRRCSA